MEHNASMRTAGIREARQNLSALIDEVRKGREIVITDRGKPVARLVPPAARRPRPFSGRAEFRRTMPVVDPPLSAAIVEDRADRL
jgi:prevent-host-death family protein